MTFVIGVFVGIAMCGACVFLYDLGSRFERHSNGGDDSFWERKL